MRTLPILVIFLLTWGPWCPLYAQFFALGGGWIPPRALQAFESPFGPDRSDFRPAGLFALDLGTRFYPYTSLGFHYGYSKQNIRFQRSDTPALRADLRLTTHTFTVETRVRTPSAYRFRLYGLVGGGLSHSALDLRSQVGTPFPRGAPDSATSWVFSYGGGVERHLHQLIHLRVEFRDDVARAPVDLFRPQDRWHRLALIGGFMIGL